MNPFAIRALRIALRDLRAARFKFVFVAFGIAAGVGALTGVRGFSEGFRGMLLREARTLMAADLTVRLFAPPNPQQQQALDSYVARGAALTAVTETVSMVSSAAAGAPLLTSLKAIDPQRYPFYGRVTLDPPAPLSAALTPRAVAVSDDLALRLNAWPGSELRIGNATFRVAAVVRAEPDRLTGSLNIGPRLMLSADGLAATGLMTLGSRGAFRFLFKLPPRGIDVAAMRSDLKQVFPDGLVADYRETHPVITRMLERSTTFLSLVSLIALIVGGLGVAMAINAHIRQQMDSIATLKCLGARAPQILWIYSWQTVLVGFVGGLGGVALGAVVQQLIPLFLRRYFPVAATAGWSAAFAWQGLAAGMLVALLFTLPPLLAIRAIRPAWVLRREMAEARPPWRERLRRLWPAALCGAIILTGLGFIAAWLSDHARTGVYFLVGLCGGLLVLAVFASGLLWTLRRALARCPWPLKLSLRHGLANIYRPGNHAAAILVALGIGVMFTTVVYLVQDSLIEEALAAAPPGAPNVFLINVTEAESAPLAEFLRAHRGVESGLRLLPLVRARLTRINGEPVTEPSERHGRRGHFRFTRSLTWLETQPKEAAVSRGVWWPTGSSEPLCSVSDEVASLLGIDLGATLEWTATTRVVTVRVAAIHRPSTAGMRSSFDIVMNRAALAGLPVTYIGEARVKPAEVGALQRDAYARFPTVTVINAADVMALVQEVVDQAAALVRFVSGFAIFAGAVILAATVAGARLRRMREAAVLKTLGATRARLVAILSVEFAVIGALAGLLGAGLASVFARTALTRLLEVTFRFDWRPVLAAGALTALLAVAAGWLASARILNARPLDVLRGE